MASSETKDNVRNIQLIHSVMNGNENCLQDVN